MQPKRRGCGRRPGKGVAEVDLGLPVKQCVEWALGRGLGGLLVNHTGSAHCKRPMAKKREYCFELSI